MGVLTMTTADILAELAAVKATIAKLTAALDQAEGQRDALQQQLLDAEGAHDRRPVAVR
jgi:hypothetical protein